MLGLGPNSPIRAPFTASSARSRDTHQLYAAELYRQALLSLGDSPWPNRLSATSSADDHRPRGSVVGVMILSRCYLVISRAGGAGWLTAHR